MPEQEPEPNTEEIEDEPARKLQDPDDYHRRQRLKEIHKRRSQVHKAIDNMDFFTKKDEHGKNKNKLGMIITSYIAELEPLIHRTEASPELPDPLPWDGVSDYADKTGSYYNDEGNLEISGYEASMAVFRACNNYLADVKPLIEEEKENEWEMEV